MSWTHFQIQDLPILSRSLDEDRELCLASDRTGKTIENRFPLYLRNLLLRERVEPPNPTERNPFTQESLRHV